MYVFSLRCRCFPMWCLQFRFCSGRRKLLQNVDCNYHIDHHCHKPHNSSPGLDPKEAKQHKMRKSRVNIGFHSCWGPFRHVVNKRPGVGDQQKVRLVFGGIPFHALKPFHIIHRATRPCKCSHAIIENRENKRSPPLIDSCFRSGLQFAKLSLQTVGNLVSKRP